MFLLYRQKQLGYTKNMDRQPIFGPMEFLTDTGSWETFDKILQQWQNCRPQLFQNRSAADPTILVNEKSSPGYWFHLLAVSTQPPEVQYYGSGPFERALTGYP